jgi:uncharacterized protein (TIGR03437 family)
VCGLTAAWSQQYNITTVAGNGAAGFADGSDPTTVQFNSPNLIALDSKGALYIADTTNHRVRMISGNTVTTIAGTGNIGQGGNNGPAASATLNSPGGVAVDSAGTIYIADTGNNMIRKISGGTITLFAGTGNANYSGDNGPALNAELSGPTGVAVDSAGNLYIADTNNNLIRKVDKSGNITSYVGGTGPTARSLNHPTGVWIDAANVLYISDTGNRRIAKFANNVFSNIAGNQSVGFSGDGGPATRAMLNNPVGIAVDSAGNLYIADANNSRIRKVTTDGNIVTIAGKGGASYSGDGGPATSAGLFFPRGIAVDSGGKVYIADTQNNVIRLLTPVFPTIGAGGVLNAAGFTPRLSPGALASVFGTGFTALFPVTSDAPWPASVAGATVTVNGVASPIYYLSSGQINFQVPWATAPGTGNVVVTVNGGASNTVSVPVSASATGLFYDAASGAAIVQNQDYSLNTPSNPAARGSTIIAYFTGSGPVSPAQSDGVPAPATGLVNMTSAYSAKIGSAAAQVTFGGLAPGFIGLGQMNIVVPATLAPGTYPLSITIGSETSNTATIAVK